MEGHRTSCSHFDAYRFFTPEVLLDCFELARDIRLLDMRASPYELSAWGFEPVAIETPDGKAEYVRQQREFAERGNALREQVVAAIGVALGAAD